MSYDDCQKLSVINESNYYNKVSEVIESFGEISKVKGEYVIVIAKDGYNE